MSEIASELTESEIGHLRQQFRLLDADGDGILTASELQTCIREIEGEMLEDKLDVTIPSDTAYDVEAFIAATCRRPNETLDDAALHRAFAQRDRNNDASLTYEELVKVIGSAEDAKQVLKDVGSSTITFETFKRMIMGVACCVTQQCEKELH